MIPRQTLFGSGLVKKFRIISGFEGRLTRQISTGTISFDYKRQVLSQTEVDSYNKDGYLLLKNFLTPEEKENVVNWCDEIQSWPETPGKWFSYFETISGKKALCRTENFLPYHQGMKDLIETRLVKAISDCIGEESCLFKEKVNYKLPNGGAFPAHQDAPAYITFNQKLHITAMVAVDDMTEQNGCLKVVPGRHNEGVIKQDPSGNIHPDEENTMDWQSMTCDSGAVMIFNAFVPHKSAKNGTTKPRRAFYLTFNAISDGGYRRDMYYEDKRKMFPPEIERVPGVDYSEGGKVYNLATPITNKKF